MPVKSASAKARTGSGTGWETPVRISLMPRS
jgi:hypothetical protein